MILVDSRIGSADLVAPLKRMGLDVIETTLQFGDVAFEGKGPNGTTVDIGIELKKLPDLVSSLRTGRLSGHQLPGLLGPHGVYDHAWLLIEGRWKVDAKGQVTVPSRYNWKALKGMGASELQKKVMTLEMCGGMHVHYANTRPDTLQFISTLYHWFCDRSMDHHTSHLTVHTPQSFLPVSEFRAAVQRFPGIGPRASLAVEKHFGGSLRKAVNAPVAEWAEVQTTDGKGKLRRLGIPTAVKIVEFCIGS